MFKNCNYKMKKGFTLIELLMVISIVSLLSSVIIGGLNDARAKGRDAARLKQMMEVRNAIELYYSDHGFYPSMLDYNGDPIDEDYDVPGRCPGDGTCDWTESQEDNFLWQLWDVAHGGGGYLGNKPVDPFWGGGDLQWEYQYQYQLYPAGTEGCPVERGDFYVFGMGNMESVDWPETHPTSPGWTCPSRDWSDSLQWVTGNFTN